MAQDGAGVTPRGYTFEEIELGMKAGIEKEVREEDIVAFAGVSGDYNLVHLDEAFARETRFGARISHGMLTASYISAVFGMRLPGPGAIYVTQTLNFKRPVWIGDVIRTTVTVAEMFPAKRRVRFECQCLNGEDKVVLEGEAMMMIPARERDA